MCFVLVLDPVRHKPIGFYNQDGRCLLRGTG